MIFEQYQLACLSLSSYLIADEDTRHAVVIDPQRDIGQYLAEAEARNLDIKQVILTHFHADYVSGHLELAAATGAEICFGDPAEAEFAIRNLHDGERITLGDVALEVWATPGHTPESISLLVFEHAEDGAPCCVLTGDTLFVGDVGRPDLLGAIGFTAEALGHQLYGSINRLKGLPSETRVYPGHGAGSACGKQLGSEPWTTIGDQLATNYAMQDMEADDFVAMVTAGQPAAPAYFLHDAITNRKDHAVFDPDRVLADMHLPEAATATAVIIDTRDPESFAAGHVQGAVNVTLDGRFAEQAGTVVPADSDVVIVGSPGTAQEAMVRLGRIGFDRVVAAVPDYESELNSHADLRSSAHRFDAHAVPSGQDVQLIDVRNPGETELGVIPDAHLIPLGALAGRASELDATVPTVVYCASGVRSSVAASWLRLQGFSDVTDVRGGYQAWSANLSATG